jgi:excisionase family DNA binding protein
MPNLTNRDKLDKIDLCVYNIAMITSHNDTKLQRRTGMAESLKLRDVAKILNVSPRTVQREVFAGRLSAFKVGKALRFWPEDIEKYIEKQRVKAGEKLDEVSESPEGESSDDAA